jgi:hypothetical protein
MTARCTISTTVTSLTSIPADGSQFPPTGGYERRKIELGFEFYF